MCKALESVMERPATNSSFAGLLKERLAGPGKLLLEAISLRSSEPARKTVGDVSYHIKEMNRVVTERV